METLILVSIGGVLAIQILILLQLTEIERVQSTILRALAHQQRLNSINEMEVPINDLPGTINEQD